MWSSQTHTDTHSGSLLSHTKEIMPFTGTGTDLKIITICKPEKNKYRRIPLTCESKNSDASELIYKTETDSQIQKTNCGLTKSGGEGWIRSLGLTDAHCCIQNRSATGTYCITQNYIQYLVITYKGKQSKTNIYIYIIKSLCCTPETNTKL